MISYFQESTSYEPVAGGVVPEHESTYTQNFTFDILGNMTTKTSAETVYPEKTIGDALNYSIDFSCAEGFVHRCEVLNSCSDTSAFTIFTDLILLKNRLTRHIIKLVWVKRT